MSTPDDLPPSPSGPDPSYSSSSLSSSASSSSTSSSSSSSSEPSSASSTPQGSRRNLGIPKAVTFQLSPDPSFSSSAASLSSTSSPLSSDPTSSSAPAGSVVYLPNSPTLPLPVAPRPNKSSFASFKQRIRGASAGDAGKKPSEPFSSSMPAFLRRKSADPKQSASHSHPDNRVNSPSEDIELENSENRSQVIFEDYEDRKRVVEVVEVVEGEAPKKKVKPRDGYDPNGLPIQSLDYDQFNSDVLYKELKRKTKKIMRNEHTIRWILTFIVGLIVALVALLISVAVHNIFEAKLEYTYSKIEQNDWYVAYLFNLSTNIALVTASCVLCIFIEPIAAGGGIAEVKSLLNGMKIPRAVHFKTLCVKITGLCLSVSAGLPAGKEGPMIHAGAIIAAGMSQGKSSTLGWDTSWTKFQPFRNDREKRDFISCGAAAGVGAAFASPIGGMLFALEEGASFWNQGLTVRCFFCTMVTTTFIAILFSATSQNGKSQRVAGLFTFGDFNVSDQNVGTYQLYELIFFALIGVIGGVLGGLWIRLNTVIMRLRGRFTRQRPLRQMFDVIFVMFCVTSTKFFFCYLFRHECYTLPISPSTGEPYGYNEGYVKGVCEDGQYNEMFTLLLSQAETAILSLYHNPKGFQIYVLVIFFLAYFILSCMVCGLPLPVGLFIPALCIGATMGRAFGQFFQFVMPGQTVDAGTYALIGSAAFMGGMFRSLLALCVMLIEATGNIQYGLPLMLALMCAKFAGDRISLGIYEVQIAMRKWAFLEPEAPDAAIKLQAHEIMNTEIHCIKEVMKAGEIYQLLLQQSESNAFPVVAADHVTTATSKLPEAPAEAIPRKMTADAKLNGAVDVGEPLPPDYDPPAYLQRYSTFWMPTSDEARLENTQATKYGSFRGLILRKHLLVILKHKAWVEERPVPGVSAPLLQWYNFEWRYPRYPELKDIYLDDTERNRWIDVTPYMHRSPNTVFWFAPVTQVYNIFRTLGLRHLVVLNAMQDVVGLITRKSLAHDFMEAIAHNRDPHNPNASHHH